jgi:hypothetical protein
MRTKGKTSDEELQDAIKRIDKKPEAKQKAQDSAAWKDFLLNVIGIREASLATDAGQNFWDKVGEGIKNKNRPMEKPFQEPTEKRRFYINPKTRAISYRDSKGRFTSYQSVGLTKPRHIRLHVGQRVYTNYKTNQISYRNVYGRWTKKPQ